MYIISSWFDVPGESIGLKFNPSQSELFRFNPISVSEPMRIIPSQYDKPSVSRLMKNGQKSIRLNPTNSETSIRRNLNKSITKFSIQINPNQSDIELIWTEFSIRINPNESKVGMIRIDSNWKFGLDQFEIELIWIENLVSDFLKTFLLRLKNYISCHKSKNIGKYFSYENDYIFFSQIWKNVFNKNRWHSRGGVELLWEAFYLHNLFMIYGFRLQTSILKLFLSSFYAEKQKKFSTFT